MLSTPIIQPMWITSESSFALSSSPFPRHGHSVAVKGMAAAEEVYLFGGVANGELRNDVFLLPGSNMSASLVQTAGDVPSPRYGHTSGMIGSVMVVWYGSNLATTRVEGELDNGLYLLNLGRHIDLHTGHSSVLMEIYRSLVTKNGRGYGSMDLLQQVVSDTPLA